MFSGCWDMAVWVYGGGGVIGMIVEQKLDWCNVTV